MIPEKEYNWLMFAQSYILLARLACQELLDSRKNKHSKVVGVNLKEFHSIKYQSVDLFIPIVFNIKHGLEVFIKTIQIFSIGKYEQGHDIKKLFSELQKLISKKIELIKNRNANDINIVELPKSLKKLEKLILKYHHCNFINNGKVVVNINDVTNDIFRYPENKAEVKINLELITIDDIKKLKDDIDNIYTLFNSVGYILDFYKN